MHSQFGNKEVKIKIRQLPEEFGRIGMGKMIRFCLKCDNVISDVYPYILLEFDIQRVNIVQYLLEENDKGYVDFAEPYFT